MASSLETNKVVAAVLTAGVIALGAGVTSRILYHPAELDETAYVIDVAEEGDAEGGGESAPVPIGNLLAEASEEDGEGVARACTSCHSFEEGGANKIGPALHGVVGREVASVGDFQYSDALAGLDGTWTYEALDGFLTNPSDYAPGTKMSYAGVKSDGDRANLIMYLRSVSPDAPPLPEPEEVSEPQVAEGEGEGAGGGVIAMIASADPAAGESASKKCAACHSFDEGGANKIGPALHGVVGREIASVADFQYSDALSGKEGTWDYESLDGFLTNPSEWASGTKMSFAGVKKEQERAELIAYLKSISPDAPPLPEGGGSEEAAAEGDGGEEQQAAAEGEQSSGDEQQAAAEGEQSSGEEQQAAAEDEQPSGEEQQAAAEGEQASGEEQQAAAEGEQASGEEQQAAAEPQAEGDGEQGASTDDGGGGAIVAMIADADPAAGETTAKRKCAVCHSFEEGGPNKVGPNLHGVVGNEVASAEGFKYSGALQDKEGSWDYAMLDAFLTDPRGWAQGTRMAFAGLKDEQERAEVISYLRSISPDAPELSQ